MITWVRLWPLLALPTLLVAGLGALPTGALRGQPLGGGPWRQVVLNHVLLPLLPGDAAAQVVNGFARATVLQEWLVTALIALNINVALLPVLYGAGTLLVRASAALAKQDLQQKRAAARR